MRTQGGMYREPAVDPGLASTPLDVDDPSHLNWIMALLAAAAAHTTSAGMITAGSLAPDLLSTYDADSPLRDAILYALTAE